MRKGAVRRFFLCRLDDGYTISSEVKVKIIVCIDGPAVIEKILKHLGLDEASQARNRSPPEGLFSHSTRLF
jgi:hypothetical protein